MKRSRQALLYAFVFIGAVLLTVGVAALLLNINERQTEARQSPLRIVEIGADELDPAVWGQNFPVQYEMFQRTAENYGRTAFGGSEPFSHLEENPNLLRLYAGYAFSIEYNEERGHAYALIDQQESERVIQRPQPGACANCHSAETPVLIAEMGWEEFNHTPYNDLSANLHTGSSCHDCHDPETMELTITRPAFVNAMAARGIDVAEATQQEMRTYVCAQCHVEYYFAGEDKVLTFPWSNGLAIENIEAYYQEVGHIDWTNAESGSPLLKMQHPEFEMYSSGIHARAGVACADCHMPYTRVGSVKYSDHWLRSPLTNVSAACQTCHNVDEDELVARVVDIQTTTSNLLDDTETAILDAIDAIVAAQTAGATDEQLEASRTLHRGAQMRWDFVSSENSTGFHSPQEAARILAEAIDLARQAQISALSIDLAETVSVTGGS